MASIKSILLESPAGKTAINVLIPIVASVLSGAFVTSITTANGELAWGTFYEGRPFWLLVGLVAIMYFYYRASYDYEVSRFSDNEFCQTYMRQACLPELAAFARQMIKQGKTEELLKVTQDVNDFLGLGGGNG